MSKTGSVKTSRAANRGPLTGILFISLILRWILVLRGGQYYFSDEGRYETSQTFVDLATSGNFSGAFSHLFIAPEHLGFKIIGLLPALVEQYTHESLVLPALFFSLFSVLNLYLIHRISRRAGATDKESLYVLILAASIMSLLYYARHLVPYDPAMTFGLLAVHAALEQKSSPGNSFTCGIFGFLCFITYNGYWSLAALAMMLHVFRNWRNSGLVRTSALSAAGLIVPGIVLVAISRLAGTNLLDEYRTFSSTVSQGSYAEGWSLPFEYFWHSEHIFFIALMVLSVMALFKREGKISVLMWIGAATCIYLCLIIFSVFLHSFVVYGRLARQMTPFLILSAGGGLAWLEQKSSSGQKLVQVILAVIVLQAAWNYKASFDLTYPREFAWEAQTRFPDFDFSEKRLAFGAPTLCRNNGYIAEYVKHFAVPPEANPPVQGQILLAALHPDNFPPYQYEGYTRAERQIFHVLNPEMRLYKADTAFMSDSNPAWTMMKNCVVNEK